VDKLILLGGGGHCRSCIDVIEAEGKYEITGILDIPEKIGTEISGYTIIDTDINIEKHVSPETYFLITVGQIKSSKIREKLFKLLQEHNAKIASIISPLAYVSKNAEVGNGSIIMHYALVNAGAYIGKNCIINTKSLIEHEAVIGNHCHISTGAIANGGAIIGSGTFLGSNAVTKQNVEIGEHCVIGAGVAVYKNIKSDSVYVG
jgi:sugar O-acyltransferase (sialic acid O-acetyltransferase NeuD family)